MKRLLLILALLSIALISTEDALSASKAERHVFLSVILDSRPNNDKQWNILRALLLKGVHSLREGDKLEILVARPGNPSTKISTVLGQPDSFERDRIIEVVSGVHKEFLFGADLGKAMKAAFDSLRENDSRYQCCLMVLTDGRVDDRQADQILRLSSVFRTRGWPVCITCDGKEASRQLLAAGNRRELDLRFIDRPFLQQWLSSVRLAGRSDVVSVGDESEAESTDADKVEGDATATDSPSLQPAIEQDKTASRPAVEDKDLVNVRIVNMPSFVTGRGAATRKAPEANDVPSEQPATIGDSEESRSGTKEPDDETTQTGRRKPFLTLAVAAGGLLAIGLFAAVLFVLKDGRSLDKFRSDLTVRDAQNQCIASRIVAYVGDRRQDLGDADTVTEITIGRGLSSTVYIDDESVRDTHLRIFKARKTLKAQNLANAPVMINGTELRPKAKMQLALPADIELAPGLSITLLTEPIEPDMEVDSDENQAE